MELKNEDCGESVIIICAQCGELFDLIEDLEESDCDIDYVVKEKCGSSELLCWQCRDCN